MTNTLVTIGYTQARLPTSCLVDPVATVNLTNLSKHTLPNAMSTQTNALIRANANAGKECSIRNVDNNQTWDNTT